MKRETHDTRESRLTSIIAGSPDYTEIYERFSDRLITCLIRLKVNRPAGFRVGRSVSLSLTVNYFHVTHENIIHG